MRADSRQWKHNSEATGEAHAQRFQASFNYQIIAICTNASSVSEIDFQVSNRLSLLSQVKTSQATERYQVPRTPVEGGGADIPSKCIFHSFDQDDNPLTRLKVTGKKNALYKSLAFYNIKIKTVF